MLFRFPALREHSTTPGRNASAAADAGGPSLRVASFEDSLPDEADIQCRHPPNVGLASEARSTTRRRRRREDEYEAPSKPRCVERRWISSGTRRLLPG
jgi:hypothetical protein